MRRISSIRLPCPKTNIDYSNYWSIFINDEGIIVDLIQDNSEANETKECWDGDFISPRGVDLQINGGFGLNFSELTLNDLPILLKLLDRLWIDGIEAICPTIVSCSLASLRDALSVLRAARSEVSPTRCKLLGAHLEGPFLNIQKKGAHSIDFLCQPTISALSDRISGFEGEIDLVTLAPELPGAFSVIKELRRNRIKVCLGHSKADDQISKKAFSNGICMITHTFNAMEGLHHRSPGPIGEAIKSGGVAMGLIADGIHVHPNIAVLLQSLAPKQLVLVSDIIGVYGLDVELVHWDKRLIFVRDGSCQLQDGTLAGSAVPLLEGVKRLASWNNEIASSIWSGTIAPRNVLNPNKTLNSYFLEKPFTQFLRWHVNSDSNELTWQKAE